MKAAGLFVRVAYLPTRLLNKSSNNFTRLKNVLKSVYFLIIFFILLMISYTNQRPIS